MGYFQVWYDSSVVNYNHRGFIRLATGGMRNGIGLHFKPKYGHVTRFYINETKNIPFQCSLLSKLNVGRTCLKGHWLV